MPLRMLMPQGLRFKGRGGTCDEMGDTRSEGRALRLLQADGSRAKTGRGRSIGATLQQGAPTLWRPLRTPVFRRLILADVVSDIGTFMQSVGAAWLMLSLGAGPMYVALTQTATALPFFVLALPAGSIGDIVDRRKLILYTEFWMVGVATVLAVTTIVGLISPWLLLALTFALSAGDAIETPTWRAILPEMVKKEDLAAASALNGIEFNFARAVG